jgi:hypothetical protein
MTNADRHHGEQAANLACKTIRALRNSAITIDDLIIRCKHFCRLRAKHIARKNLERPRANAQCVALKSGLRARRLVSVGDIDRTGHKMQNCLANVNFGKEFKTRLRKRQIELYLLETSRGLPKALLSISEDGSVEQVKGPNNARPLSVRSAIIEFLVRRAAEVGECPDLFEIGICDELIHARLKAASKCFQIKQRHCEVGASFLIVLWNEQSVLLRSETYIPWGADSCVVFPCDESRLAQVEFRVWLRAACLDHPEFARACREAFFGAPEVFLRDWMG